MRKNNNDESKARNDAILAERRIIMMFQPTLLKRAASKMFKMLLCILISVNCFTLSTVFAEESKDSSSITYVFDKNSKYELTDGVVEENPSHYGELSISGDAQVGTWNGISTFYVNSGTLSLYYRYDKDINSVAEDEWQVCEDSVKKVNNIDLKKKLGYGVIIVQSSKDGEIWSTESVETNAFENVTNRKESIYNTTDVQLNAGAHYRVIAAYKMERYVDTTHILIISQKRDEYTK